MFVGSFPFEGNRPYLSQMRKALFPGSFDPVTVGHVEIVRRGLALFDEVIVAIGENSAKKYLFSLEERLEMLRLSFAGLSGIRIASYNTLTVDFAREQGAFFLLRGLRDSKDLDYERPISTINHHLDPDMESVFLVSDGQYADISSTLVREVIRYGRNPKGMVPEAALPVILNRQASEKP